MCTYTYVCVPLINDSWSPSSLGNFPSVAAVFFFFFTFLSSLLFFSRWRLIRPLLAGAFRITARRPWLTWRLRPRTTWAGSPPWGWPTASTHSHRITVTEVCPEKVLKAFATGQIVGTYFNSIEVLFNLSFPVIERVLSTKLRSKASSSIHFNRD